LLKFSELLKLAFSPAPSTYFPYTIGGTTLSFPGITTDHYGKYRRERSWRVAIFFGGAALAGAFGGILAYLIGKMDGVGGRKGWQW